MRFLTSVLLTLFTTNSQANETPNPIAAGLVRCEFFSTDLWSANGTPAIGYLNPLENEPLNQGFTTMQVIEDNSHRAEVYGFKNSLGEHGLVMMIKDIATDASLAGRVVSHARHIPPTTATAVESQRILTLTCQQLL